MTAALDNVTVWRGGGIRIGPERILRLHRYTDPSRVRPPIREAAVRAALRMAEIAAPEARYVRRRIVACRDGVLEVDGGHRFTCPAFDRLLADCTEVVVFVLTIGPALDAEIAELNARSELLDALFYESAGWLTVEQASRRFGGDLRRAVASEGLGVTFRLGPGYDYRGGENQPRTRWELDEQGALFAVFGDAKLPVELGESSVMWPRMSRSGLFGLEPRR